MTDDKNRKLASKTAGSPAIDLADAWASYRTGDQPDPGTACPSPNVLAALTEGVEGAEGADREGVLDHVLSCEGCRFELRAATEALRFAEDLSNEAKPAPGNALPTTSRFSRSLLLLAALGLVILGLGVWKTMSDSSTRPAGATEETVRSGTAREQLGASVSPVSNAEPQAFPESFSWPAVEGARTYRLMLYSQSAELLWAGSWNDALGAVVPAPTAVATQGSSVYYWEVEIEGVSEIRPLGPFWFDVSSTGEERN